jgi:hypothetical protein
VIERLNQSFLPRLVRNCSDQEIRLLTVIAEHSVTNGGIFDSIGQLSEVLNIEDIRELRWLLSHLARSDLIEVQHEGYQIWDNESFKVMFSVPMLDEYFRKVAPS